MFGVYGRADVPPTERQLSRHGEEVHPGQGGRGFVRAGQEHTVSGPRRHASSGEWNPTTWRSIKKTVKTPGGVGVECAGDGREIAVRLARGVLEEADGALKHAEADCHGEVARIVGDPHATFDDPDRSAGCPRDLLANERLVLARGACQSAERGHDARVEFPQKWQYLCPYAVSHRIRRVLVCRILNHRQRAFRDDGVRLGAADRQERAHEPGARAVTEDGLDSLQPGASATAHESHQERLGLIVRGVGGGHDRAVAGQVEKPGLTFGTSGGFQSEPFFAGLRAQVDASVMEDDATFAAEPVDAVACLVRPRLGQAVVKVRRFDDDAESVSLAQQQVEKSHGVGAATDRADHRAAARKKSLALDELERAGVKAPD